MQKNDSEKIQFKSEGKICAELWDISEIKRQSDF